ncbi:uncharacterized protein DNG_10267 [Cephalotrichum gorgonifer]|uniref:2-dehydropantoate 2-reductase n=1 Tax=Cephalotrichum gorgonifer TaxID=2041049 RepID=A0AAE8N961_9PEZI|nr:uncharacterized protein DNG_10267 [Cephalotrichum gorgonifer]
MSSPVPPNAERIHILGAGNLGQYLARGLTRQNPLHPVTLLLHRPSLLQDWESAGSAIECETNGQVDHTTGISVELIDGDEDGDGAAPGVDGSSGIKNLIVACKTYMTVPALRRVRNRLDEGSTIVFLQNGMGTTEEVTKQLFPSVSTRPAYWAGICVLGVSSKKPFSIIPTGIGHITLGPVGNTLSPDSTTNSTSSHSPSNFMIQQLVQTQDPTSTVVSPTDLRKAQLLKLVANAIVNPLTTILSCKNAQLLDHDSTVALIKVLIKEAGPVIRALLPHPHPTGSESDAVDFSDEKLLEYVLMVIRKTATNTSSMLQDARSGKRTEIDYINGFIASQGERMGHLCPNHAIAVAMVQRGESVRAEHLGSRFDFN